MAMNHLQVWQPLRKHFICCICGDMVKSPSKGKRCFCENKICQKAKIDFNKIRDRYSNLKYRRKKIKVKTYVYV
jgi:hypothetical protein